MPKVSEVHVEQRRRQILDAASACFIAKGFHRTGMREVCEAAGLSSGAVYNYFNSKEQIVAAIGERHRAANAEAYRRSRDASAAHPVATIFRDHFMASLRDPDRLRRSVLNLDSVAEAQRNADLLPIVSAAYANAAEELTSNVRTGQRRGEIDPALDPERIAWMLLSAYFGLMAMRLLFPDLDADSIGDAVLDLLHAGAGNSS